jgi:protein ImuB
MPLAEVSSLARRRSRAVGTGGELQFVFQEHDPQQDRHALQRLAAWCERFSPIVGLEEGPSPASLLLDVTGLDHLFGGQSALAATVVRRLHELGYCPRVATADTIGAAWAAAHFAPMATAGNEMPANGQPRPVRVEADRPAAVEGSGIEDAAPSARCVAVSASQPSWWIVPAGQSRPFLEELPVACLRLSDETTQLLAELGVHSVGQLLLLPRAGLATRLGTSLVERLDQALGTRSEVIVAHRPRPDFTVDRSLDFPADRREQVVMVLEQLTARLARMLAAHDHGAVQIEAAFAEGKGPPTVVRAGFFQPTTDARHMLGLLTMQLETVRWRHAISRVQLSAVTTVRLVAHQGELWEDAVPGAARERALLIDRLSSRLGDRHVLGIEVRAGALPEAAWVAQPLAAAGTARARGARRTISNRSPDEALPERPLWLQDPPLPLTAVSVAADGPPVSFSYQGRQQAVTRYWEPERIETAWWRGPSVQRDYYRVETKTGSRFWLFRCLRTGQWFLHGIFA